MSYDSVVDLDREEWRSASYDQLEGGDDRPTLAECQRDEADRGPSRYQLPDPYPCDDPWCPARVVGAAAKLRHSLEGCAACQQGRDCTYLLLASQEPHRHGTRPDGVRV